jgi:hypothetical protein
MQMPASKSMSRPQQRSAGTGANRRTVRRRRVLYISGFDPRGASFYHRMLRDEAAKHAALTGEAMEVGARRTLSPLVQAWSIKSGADSAPVETTYEFLRWDDIVRAHWPRSTLRVWADTLHATWVYVRSGVTRAAFRTSFPIGVTMSIPALLILAQIILVAVAAVLFLSVLPPLLGWPWWSGLLPWAVAAVAVLALGRRVDAKFNAQWSGRIMAFTVRDARSRVAGFDERREAFARHLLTTIEAGGVDEILLVGHSLGTPLAASVLARALQHDPNLGRSGPPVTVLTLGQTMPMLSLMREADWFRRDLLTAGTAAEAGVDWIDFSAPPDGACFALVDPVKAANPDFRRPEGAPPCPKLLNARFAELIDPATYAKVKRDWIRLHFQYLMAADRVADYDYFRIVGGPLTLPDRYAGRESVSDYSRLRWFVK